MAALHSQMMEWNEDLEPINKELEAGVKPIVFITHDESTFNSNDGRKRIWIHEDKSHLRKKGRGQGLHVSDYVTPIGHLGGGEVCEILKCGGDTWWTGEDMLEQLINKAIPAFERSFPGCQGLFAFDNAKSHQKYAADALRTGNMNLTPGGKNSVPMQDGWFVGSDNPSVIQRQFMILPDRRLKGLQIVLQKRGLWPQGCKFLTQCSIPGQNPGTTKLNPACKYASNESCCARALLSSQPDFQEQKGELQETIEAAGHLVIFISKKINLRPAASCPPCAPDVAGAYNVNSSSGCGRNQKLSPPATLRPADNPTVPLYPMHPPACYPFPDVLRLQSPSP